MIDKCYVLGAGSIGLYVQYLIQQHVSSTLLARRHTVEALVSNPLRISGLQGSEGEEFEASAEVRCIELSDVERFGPNDFLFVVVKAHDVDEVLNQLEKRLAPETTVVLCQNGIGVFESARARLSGQPLIRLHCWMGIVRESLFHIRVAGVYKFDVSALPEHRSRADELMALMLETGVRCDQGDIPALAEWQKSLWNIAVNGLCSIADAQNGAIVDNPELEELARGLLEESRRVARLDGVELTDNDIEQVFASLAKTKSNINATLQDLRAGRHPELEYLNGAVARIALRHGERAPLNDTVYKLVAFLERTEARRRK